MKHMPLVALMAILVLTAQTCIPNDAEEEPAQIGGNPFFDTTTECWIDAGDGLDGQVICHEGFVTSYNPETLIPNWVSYELLPEEVVKNGGAQRSDTFVEDPMVIGTCSSTDDYTNSGYGRGHMAPAADFKYSASAMDETFYMSNVAPQDKNLNAGAWNDLEMQVRFWSKNYYKTGMRVICGPIVEEGCRRIGENGVAVPSAFWKVICRLDSRSGKYEAIGFLFPNEPTDRPYTDFAVPIDKIEQLTGYDFLSNLPEATQEEIESSVKFKQWKTRERN